MGGHFVGAADGTSLLAIRHAVGVLCSQSRPLKTPTPRRFLHAAPNPLERYAKAKDHPFGWSLALACPKGFLLLSDHCSLTPLAVWSAALRLPLKTPTLRRFFHAASNPSEQHTPNREATRLGWLLCLACPKGFEPSTLRVGVD